jgi:hypothetical protein
MQIVHMYQSCHNTIGVLTVCHNFEQPYLCQNKIFLWCFLGFWFLMIIGWHSGYLEADCPADWYVIFSFMIKDWTWYRKSSWQVDMSGERGHSTWSCIRILCWDPPNVYLCFVWSQIQKSACYKLINLNLSYKVTLVTITSLSQTSVEIQVEY